MAAENNNRTSPSGVLSTRQVERASAPLVTDDFSKGFLVFSQWVDVTNPLAEVIYVLVDDTTGAAVWVAYGVGAAGGVPLASVPSARGFVDTEVLGGTLLPLNIVLDTVPLAIGFTLVGQQLVYNAGLPTRRFLVNASAGMVKAGVTACVIELSMTVLGTAAQPNARSRVTGVTDLIGGMCSFSTIVDLAAGQGVGLQMDNITNDDDITLTTGQITVTAL